MSAIAARIRPPQQQRSQRTWTRILDSAVEILEERGHEGLTIAAICERAGVSPPTLYARAPDKASLLHAVHHHATEVIESDMALTSAGTPGEAVRDLVAGLLRHAPLLRAVIRQAGAEPGLYAPEGSPGLLALGRRFRNLVGGDERRADACYRVIIGAVAHRVVEGSAFTSDVPQSDEEFVAALGEIADLYLASPAD